MSARDVILWVLDEAVADDNERHASARVTDVFYRQSRPKPGALLLGVGNATDNADAVVLIGVARRSQQVATGKDRTLITPVFRLPTPVALQRLEAELPPDVPHGQPAVRDG